MKRWLLIIVMLVISGCATSQKVIRPDGAGEYLIQCGSGTGWNVCYSKANEVCPAGYTDLEKDGGFNYICFFIKSIKSWMDFVGLSP